MLTAIAGIQWGDEGKGRMVDLLSANYAIICRYQGGNNAGHTVINDRGTFVLNLLPSGILRETTVNVLGHGMVIDPKHLMTEIAGLTAQGISITPERLRISERATLCLPYHVLLDNLEEDRLADKQFGSTRRGIAPVYADRAMKKTLRMSDLRDLERTRATLTDILEWKNLLIEAYGHAPITVDETMALLTEAAQTLLPYVTDVSAYLQAEAAQGTQILFEAQLGALRDLEYGIYPYTSSSTTLAAYAPIGAGIPGHPLDQTIGVIKAYSSCVGEGPFVAELVGREADALREAGSEFGAATGRPRRIGPFDIPASRYGVAAQAPDILALTKLDVLANLPEIPLVVAYEIDGIRTERFPSVPELERATPIVETMPGFGDIRDCRHKDQLPEAALAYIRRIQESVGCKVRYVSVGPDRDAYIDFEA